MTHGADASARTVDRTIVRPTVLTDKPKTGAICALTDLAGFHGGKIARADVASFVVTELDRAEWTGKAPLITSA
ncbi:NAD(P)H-binding protein [Jiella pacifica]|uniref:NAD(P)H-binding protein n=1 Tax=Jiella pacifica TaxID=2696469 RepID=UPI0028AC8D78|nr:NAD(P)H-binding protein [Jiella pacifica]